MTFVGNTTVTVFRGETTDAFGDPVDVNTPIHTGLRFSLIEQTRRVFVPAENQDRVIRFTRGRTQSNIVLVEGDRVFDEQSEITYIVEAVVNPGSPYSSGDTRVDLKHVT